MEEIILKFRIVKIVTSFSFYNWRLRHRNLFYMKIMKIESHQTMGPIIFEDASADIKMFKYYFVIYPSFPIFSAP